jgi:hypothetical protein
MQSFQHNSQYSLNVERLKALKVRYILAIIKLIPVLQFNRFWIWCLEQSLEHSVLDVLDRDMDRK